MSAPQDAESRESPAAGPADRPAGPVTGQGSSSSRAAASTPAPCHPREPPRLRLRSRRPPTRKMPLPEPSQAVEEDLDALLADTQRERDEYLDLAKRTKADFENYRKRMAAEVAAAGSGESGAAVGSVLPVLDDLERALLRPRGLDPERRLGGALAHGVLLVFRELRDALAQSWDRGRRPDRGEVRPEPARGALDPGRRGGRGGDRRRDDAEGLPAGRAADPACPRGGGGVGGRLG